MENVIPAHALCEFRRRFNQASQQPWYYFSPWEKLDAIKKAYCKEAAFPLEEQGSSALQEAYQAKERKTYVLPFFDYLIEIHGLIEKNPNDAINRCMLDWAVSENFTWLNRQRCQPLHPRLEKIMEGLLRHYIHQQIELAIFQSELAVNWASHNILESEGWLKRPTLTETWGLQTHADGVTQEINLKKLGLQILPLNQLMPTAVRCWHSKPEEPSFLATTIRNSPEAQLLERFKITLGHS